MSTVELDRLTLRHMIFPRDKRQHKTIIFRLTVVRCWSWSSVDLVFIQYSRTCEAADEKPDDDRSDDGQGAVPHVGQLVHLIQGG